MANLSIYQNNPNVMERVANEYGAAGELQNRLAELANQQQKQGYEMRALQRAEDAIPAQQAEAERTRSEGLRKHLYSGVREILLSGTPDAKERATTWAYTEGDKFKIPKDNTRMAISALYTDQDPQAIAQSYDEILNPDIYAKQRAEARFRKPEVAKPVDPIQAERLALEKAKFEWEKGKPAKSVGDVKPIYDTASNEWVYPPSEEFPQGRRTGDVGKMNAQAAAQTIINEFRGSEGKPGVIDTTPTGGPLGAVGVLSRVTNTQKVREFENMKESLSAQMRALLRIPGEGALSDREQAQYGLQLPDVSNSPEVNKGILKRLETVLGIRASSTPVSVSPTQTSGAFDAEKEARYQAWKAQQGK